MILVPIIRVKDNYSGSTHIVGEDHHDRLVLRGRGLHYLNIQSMTGTEYGEYNFQVELQEVGFDDYECEAEMVSVEEAVKLWTDMEKEAEENERQLKEALARTYGGKPEDIQIMS